MRIGASLIAFTLLAACGSDPADVAGEYSISLTSRDNGCNFDNWMEGDTASNIPITMTQSTEDPSMATAVVNGAAGVYLDVLLGSRTYTGDVDGSSLDLTLFGETTGMDGNCTFTVNSVLDATLDGDVLSGEIRYEKATNGNPDCADSEGCASRQEFNGTRPPT
jgi:hypothetical protein